MTGAGGRELVLDGGPLTIADVVAVARDGLGVRLGADCRGRINAARQVVERIAGGSAAVYGINTGFGSLSQQRIQMDDVRLVQKNLIESHAAGVGDPLPVDVVRAMMLILAGSLSRGRSGVRVELIEQILALLNAGITPVVPSRGSVGASGDLAPLAHAARALLGEGACAVDGKHVEVSTAMAEAGISPITLEAKEGLALINGTHLMCGIGTLALHDVQHVLDAGLCAAALAVDACKASCGPYDERMHDVRRQTGQQRAAKVLRELLAGSQILDSHRDNDPRVQDPYSLRAAPQVLGAVLDTVEHVQAVFERELDAVTDNPLVFIDTDGETGDIVSGGNFHGAPLAVAMDQLKIALAHLAGISERRVYWVLAASDSENPVNIYLSPQPGLHSGLMIVQYTAAACCNELQTLATPASVANIPTSAGMEDYNSFGATSAHQLRAAVDLCRQVVAIELLVMAEALEYHRPLKSGPGVERAHDLVRDVVPRLTEDRTPAPDIVAIEALIKAGRFTTGS